MYINVLAINSIWVSGEISNLHEFCIFANRMSVEQIGVGQIEVQFGKLAVQLSILIITLSFHTLPVILKTGICTSNPR